MNFNSIEEAVEDIKSGKMVIVVDDKFRENEGDLFIAAEKATSKDINFMAKYGRGLICVPMAEERLDYLQLDPMLIKNSDPRRTSFTVSVDTINSTTGISALERSETISRLIDDNAKPNDFTKPGHIFPLAAKPGGVLERPGHTEAAVDLSKLSGFKAAGVICEIMNEDGTMARVPDLIEFSKNHKLKMITIEDLIEYRLKNETHIEKISEAFMPTIYGEFKIIGYLDKINNKEHIALIKGDVLNKTVLTRIHSECLTGDVFGSLRCDCGSQLDYAMKKIENEESGVIIYLKQEGRGIGLLNKIKAYKLQDEGMDTVEANIALGFSEDLRSYIVAAQILKDLNVKKVKLLTNNPEKIKSLKKYGIDIVRRVSIEIGMNRENKYYLETKHKKMGHILNVEES